MFMCIALADLIVCSILSYLLCVQFVRVGTVDLYFMFARLCLHFCSNVTAVAALRTNAVYSNFCWQWYA